MPLRLMEIYLPEDDGITIKEIIENESTLDYWQQKGAKGGTVVKLLISAEHTEEILDRLEEKYANRDDFRVLLIHVEGTIPRVQNVESSQSDENGQEGEENNNNLERVSREELYTQVYDSIQLTRNYLALIVISSIVAAVGLVQDSVTIIIGAMVIAPLIGPNVGLALATTLGDWELGKAALKTGFTGTTIALVFSILVGLIFPLNPFVEQMAARIFIHPTDIIVALASGSAGVLAFSSGVATALIGVMVSVALLPPLVVTGLLLGSGNISIASGAFLLFLTNIICINLSGVATLILKGIRPRSWWEADKAGKYSRWAIGLWTLLLVILIFLIYIKQ